MALPREVLGLTVRSPLCTDPRGAEWGSLLAPLLVFGGAPYRERPISGASGPGPLAPGQSDLPELRRAGGEAPARLLAEGRRASTPGPRVPRCTPRGRGETHNSLPRNDAPLLAPAGGCSRERRRALAAAGLGAGEARGRGARGEGAEAAGRLGTRGSRSRQSPCASPGRQSFPSVNNKPAAAARADRGRPSGRRGGAAAAPTPLAGRGPRGGRRPPTRAWPPGPLRASPAAALASPARPGPRPSGVFW